MLKLSNASKVWSFKVFWVSLWISCSSLHLTWLILSSEVWILDMVDQDAPFPGNLDRRGTDTWVRNTPPSHSEHLLHWSWRRGAETLCWDWCREDSGPVSPLESESSPAPRTTCDESWTETPQQRTRRSCLSWPRLVKWSCSWYWRLLSRFSWVRFSCWWTETSDRSFLSQSSSWLGTPVSCHHDVNCWVGEISRPETLATLDTDPQDSGTWEECRPDPSQRVISWSPRNHDLL